MNIIKTIVIYIVILFLLTVFSLFPVYLYENYLQFTTLSSNTALKFIVATSYIVNELSGTVMFSFLPFVQGFIEHLFNLNIHYGPCRVKNIVRDGIIITGFTEQEGVQKKERHMRGFSSDLQEIERTCPNCKFVTIDAIFWVKDYDIVEYKFVNKKYLFWDYGYLKAALFARKVRDRLGSLPSLWIG